MKKMKESTVQDYTATVTAEHHISIQQVLQLVPFQCSARQLHNAGKASRQHKELAVLHLSTSPACEQIPVRVCDELPRSQHAGSSVWCCKPHLSASPRAYSISVPLGSKLTML